MNESYLAHYGVLGQKHGKRRYQYEDGSLTPLGRIHYGIGQGKHRTKTKATSSKTSSEETSKPKKASEMTDQELKDAVSRKDLEKRYNDSFGRQFVDAYKTKMANALAEAAANAGKKFIEKKLNTVLGLNEQKVDENAIPKWIKDLSDDELVRQVARVGKERNLYKAVKGDSNKDKS